MKARGADGRIVRPGSGAPLGAGETVLFIDPKRRRSLVTLGEGRQWHSHAGAVDHDAIIGRVEGSAVRTNRNVEVLVLRPTREDLVLKMPRGAQVVYPKDQAMILVVGDVRPGCHVVEAGAGSGALTLALLDAVGPEGEVTSFELRDEHADVAVHNVGLAFGVAPENWTLVREDVREGLPGLRADRVVLDLVDPWTVIEAAAAALDPGGILVVYVPTVPQVMRTTESLRDHGGFTDVRTVETLVRPWDVDGLAVRPAHRMVAHTAFLLSARRVPTTAEGGPLPGRRRGSAGPSVAWIDVDPALEDASVTEADDDDGDGGSGGDAP